MDRRCWFVVTAQRQGPALRSANDEDRAAFLAKGISGKRLTFRWFYKLAEPPQAH
jgi:hypothetical protein